MANISGWTTVLSLLARFAAHSGAFNAAFNTVTFVLMDTSYISKQNFTLFLSVLVSLALVRKFRACRSPSTSSAASAWSYVLVRHDVTRCFGTLVFCTHPARL